MLLTRSGHPSINAPLRIVAASALLAIACGSPQPPADQDSASPDSTAGSATDATSAELEARPPATAENLRSMGASETLAAHALWAVQTMRAADFDPQATMSWAERFTPEFLAAVPPEMLEQTRTTMLPTLAGEDTPWIEGVGPNVLSIVFEGTDGLIRMRLQVDPMQDERIAGLLYSPAIDLEPFEVTSWGEVDAEMESIGGFGAIHVAHITDGNCETLHASGMTDPMPLGSAFKLWVLAALAEDTGSGALAWGQLVTVQERLISLPSGTLQNEPVGSEHTLLDVATLMISISDNTATDHIVDLLGRERIESRMRSIDAEMADANTPLMTTRDLFLIKGTSPQPDFVDGWADLNTDERRAALQSISGRSLADFVMWPRARWIESFEWYATGDQLCRTWVALDEAGDAQPELDVILGTNPGVPLDSEHWARVWYKGGSEPGVLALSWLLVDNEGERYALSIQSISLFSDPPVTRVIRLARAMTDLLAAAPGADEQNGIDVSGNVEGAATE
jgi:hypothetical protein